MIKNFLLFVLISISFIFFIDLWTIAYSIVIYTIGFLCISLVDKNKLSLRIYQSIFLFGLIYIYLCFIYMSSNNYSYLLAWDIENYFLPNVEYFLEFNNFLKAERENFNNFNILSRYQSGYFAYLIPFAYLSKYLGSNLYISMQFSTLIMACFSGILINKLMLVNNINKKSAYKYTLIICLLSVVFFYSTQLLRDIQVMFFYLLAIYFTFKSDFSFLNLIKILLVVLISCTLRVETGLFLAITIPIYLYLTINKGKKRNLAILSSILIFLISIFIIGLKINDIYQILQNNNDFYFESDKGDGVIGKLQNIPFLGSLLAIIYNALQPLPFWLYFDAPLEDNRPQMYNIMTFPLFFSSLFNWMVISSLFFVKDLSRKMSLELSRPLLCNMLAGFLFLYIQASVIDQRRLMAYYIVFYIAFFIIYEKLSKQDKYKILLLGIGSYSIFQILILLIK
jgi:hypothetical protein